MAEEKNLFNEIDLKIMLKNEQIKNHRRSIEKAKKECGWYGPDGVSGIDYSRERTSKSVHISFQDGLRMINIDEQRIKELEDEKKELQRSKRKIRRIYNSLDGDEAKVYRYRVIEKMTQSAAAEKMPMSVRQFQRLESSMKERGLM